MREFDTNGLRLCEFQARIFEESVDRFSCSTIAFLRMFINSDFLIRLDKNMSALFPLDPNEALDEIENQFGPINSKGQKKNKNSLFWVGYMYRYISYTRSVNTLLLFKTFDCKRMFELYPVYSTQDPEWCVRSLLELYDLTEDFFDPNYRLKKAMEKHYHKLVRTI